MKKISAHYIFPLVTSPLKNGIIVLDDEKIFQEIIDTKGQIHETARLEFYSGIIIPAIEGLNISELIHKQQQMPTLHLEEILKCFISENWQGFLPGEKASVFLIFPVDMVNMRITEKSKLKKLV